MRLVEDMAGAQYVKCTFRSPDMLTADERARWWHRMIAAAEAANLEAETSRDRRTREVGSDAVK